jgi:phosphocarrier protein HPr
MNKITKTLEIVNQKGLHARASAKFVEVSETYEANVLVKRDGMQVTGESIMGLLMLAASKGTTITIEVSGTDALDCMNALEALIQSGFGETETEGS